MSNSSIKPIVFYTHSTTPNPRKVAIFLEELAIPYTANSVEISQVKQAPFTDVNPNGRLPAIEDPNTGVKLWESGAIIQYLIETYDKEGRLTYTSSPEKYELNQWLMFQMSGQGPYFGQAAWFSHFHPEKIPSAIDRYKKEITRVVSVLDGWLQNHKFLVGDKLTYADLAFVPWGNAAKGMNADNSLELDKYTAYNKWLEEMLARDSVKKVIG
ncbi:glutathione S- transferase, nitrogen catabolite repression regulator [Cladophialophora chaetospira]|uniref:Glutathione S- transferase, nitrogen catabolite repression regulator n=1 Tax=Cladophialophora chaetospira TaxID=386627 RepID=A0AA38X3C7_9EURO|nr:glutathione S- transferase, nitrogen catabolite repression regulator [Cladophialophora chaetospira]